MANQISGKVFFIDNVVEIPTKNNGVFTKRQIVLDASHYDQMTGQKFENYPAFDFVGNRVGELDKFKVGDLVTISFALNGRPFEKDGKTTYFTSVNGYKIEPYQRPNSGGQQSNAGQTSAPVISQPTQASPQTTEQPLPANGGDDLPF